MTDPKEDVQAVKEYVQAVTDHVGAYHANEVTQKVGGTWNAMSLSGKLGALQDQCADQIEAKGECTLDLEAGKQKVKVVVDPGKHQVRMSGGVGGPLNMPIPNEIALNTAHKKGPKSPAP